MRVAAIDYHETSGQGAEEIVREALPELQPVLMASALLAIGRERPWRYGEHYFLHDVKLREWRRQKRVMLGLSHLRRCARRQSIALGGFAGPLHDINSHGADAFGEYAVNCPLVAPKPVASKPRPKLWGSVFLEGPPVERSWRRTRT